MLPRRFREQMEFLRQRGFRPLTFRELTSSELSEKPVIITFDDAYESVYQQAFPILQEYGFPAVIFVIVRYVGTWNTWDANLGGLRFRHVSANQIRELAQAGWEIGSHTLTHRALTYLPEKEVDREVRESRRQLQEITGQEVLTLAYPFGLQNAAVRERTRTAGYRWACQNLWGEYRPDNPFTIRRIPVYRTDSLAAFRRKLQPGLPHRVEMSKLRLISWWAHLTPLYQHLFQP